MLFESKVGRSTCRLLHFSPTAWAKLMYWRDLGPTEVAGFCRTDPQDPYAVLDAVLLPQVASRQWVALDGPGVADYFDQQVDLGRQPRDFARIWFHTHPGPCARPSQTDRVTFEQAFGCPAEAVILILARCGRTFAQLRSHGERWPLRVTVDFRRDFKGSNFPEWEQAYRRNVKVVTDGQLTEPACHGCRRARPCGLAGDQSGR